MAKKRKKLKLAKRVPRSPTASFSTMSGRTIEGRGIIFDDSGAPWIVDTGCAGGSLVKVKF